VKAWKTKTEREYLCAGIVAATVANCNRDPKHRPKPFTPLDFAPISRPRRTEAEEEEAMTAFFAGFGIRPLNGAAHG